MIQKKIYFIGICGTAMATLAAMLRSKGAEVYGSDEHVYPPMSTFLQQQGIPILQGFDEKHLTPHPDLVVIGNAMSRGNPEVEYVLDERIPFTSLPAMVYDSFIREKYSCVVTGTHGKTTTTSMLAWILHHAGEQPSFLVGGLPANFSRSFQLGEGRHFVIEGDEYDTAFFDKVPKFLHYFPELLIINNIEFDHADIYQNLDEIKTAFQRLLRLVPRKGHVIANIDDPVVREVAEQGYSQNHWFGLSEAAAWRAVDITTSSDGVRFGIVFQGKKQAEVSLPLSGEHNIRNALAAFVAARQLAVAPEVISSALAAFQGVARRQTLVGEAAGWTIIDDFAHHATAVRETLKGIRQKYPDRRLWAIFEPRSASAKRVEFEEQYYSAFDHADRVIIAPLHRPDKVAPEKRLSVQRIVHAIRERGIQADSLPPGEEMLTFLLQNRQAGDVFVFMSNGNFAAMPDKLLDALNNK